jgi:hypothetical protein
MNEDIAAYLEDDVEIQNTDDKFHSMMEKNRAEMLA